MKKILLLPYTLLFLAFTLGSCSVDKRVYRDGYHIEWNHAKNNLKKTESAPLVEEATTASVADPTPQDNIAQEMPESVVTPVVPDQEAVKAPKEKKQSLAERKKNLIAKIIPNDTPEDEAKIMSGSKAAAFKSGFKKGLKLMMPDAESHTLHLAIASFVLGIISLVAYYGAFVLGLLAIIFGIIAIHKIRNSGGAYRGSLLAWLGLIFGIIAIVGTLIIIKVY